MNSEKEKELSNDNKILVNKIQCRKDKDIFESKCVHDFKWCLCQSITIDGDLEYLRRVGNLEDIIKIFKFKKK